MNFKYPTMKYPIILLILLSMNVLSAQDYGNKESILLMNKKDFQKNVDGKQIDLYVLKNSNGLVSEITNYGGKVVSLWIPDRLGAYEDVVLGHSNIEEYLASPEKYFGALVGRYGNRIANAKFPLDGKTYSLDKNDGNNTLHGGSKGFDSIIWEAKQIDAQTLELHYTSKNLEQGFPGNLSVKVRYQLTDANELKIEYWATTDAPTVINLTHHSFFNLAGAGNGTINDHLLMINAPYYTPVGEGLIPTGKISSVLDTPFDFQHLTPIRKRLNNPHEQLQFGKGYDHNFVLNQSVNGLNFAAKAIEPISGRVMEVYTNEPGLQFYGGNFLDGSVIGKRNKIYGFRTAFCLETQHFPDSPNHPDFPSTRLDPQDDYYSTCIYKFSVVK